MNRLLLTSYEKTSGPKGSFALFSLVSKEPIHAQS